MSTIKIQTFLLIVFLLSLPFALLSQENDTTQNNVKIKIVKHKDGNITVFDTAFTVKDDKDVQSIVDKYTVSAEHDTTTNGTVQVTVNVNKGGDETDKTIKKVIVMKSPGTDENEQVIVVGPHGKHKVIKWVDKDGNDFDFDYDYDFDYDFDTDQFREQMADQKEHMKHMRIELSNQEDEFRDQLAEMKKMKELQSLDDLAELKDLKIHVLPPESPMPPEMSYYYEPGHHKEVSDIELRDAGIKNKPNRLDLDDIDIDNDDGVIDLSFSLKEEGSPKVTVYNVYGDKVFNGKPELMNNEYQVKIDLSKKQHGTYYLMITSGNSSKTMKIHN